MRERAINALKDWYGIVMIPLTAVRDEESLLIFITY